MDTLIILYTFSSCTSCRKARDILIQNEIDFTEKNMSSEPPSKEEIKHLLAYTTNGTSDIMSKRSQEVKSLDMDIEELSLNSWIDLAYQSPGILRRPLLLAFDQLIVGYNKEEYEGLIRKYHLKHQFKPKQNMVSQVACS